MFWAVLVKFDSISFTFPASGTQTQGAKSAQNEPKKLRWDLQTTKNPTGTSVSPQLQTQDFVQFKMAGEMHPKPYTKLILPTPRTKTMEFGVQSGCGGTDPRTKFSSLKVFEFSGTCRSGTQLSGITNPLKHVCANVCADFDQNCCGHYGEKNGEFFPSHC
jgi:hypothetical protein